MKALTIIEIILAAVMVLGVIFGLCAADADEEDLQKWSEENEQHR